jgi:hypothetical protein
MLEGFKNNMSEDDNDLYHFLKYKGSRQVLKDQKKERVKIVKRPQPTRSVMQTNKPII